MFPWVQRIEEIHHTATNERTKNDHGNVMLVIHSMGLEEFSMNLLKAISKIWKTSVSSSVCDYDGKGVFRTQDIYNFFWEK